MNSEENYLDQLLNSFTANSAPERTMAEVMAERGIKMPTPEPEPVPTPEPTIEVETAFEPVEAHVIESVDEQVPVKPEAVFIADDEPLSLDEPIFAEDAVISDILSAGGEAEINSDTLADMLDLLDSPEMFTEANDILDPVRKGATSEEELDQLLASVMVEEPAVEEEIPVVEEPVIEEESLVVEEPVAEAEPQVDLDAMLADLDIQIDGDSPSEEAIALGEPAVSDDLVLGDVPSEDELAAMFASLENGEDIMPIEQSEPETSSESSSGSDLEALMAGLEEINSAPDPEPSDSDNVLSGVDNDNLDEASQDDLAALLAGIGDDSLNVDQSDDSNTSEFSAIDALDSIGDSGEDLLNLLEGIDDTTSPSDYDEIGALLNGESEESTPKKANPVKNIFSKLPFFGKKKKKGNADSDEGSDAPADSSNEENDLDDISELAELAGLNTPDAESVAAVDVAEMDALLESVDGDADYLAELEQLEDKSEGKKGKKAKKKKEKAEPDPNKPKGFFGRLLDLLTEEIDGEDEEEGKPIEEISNADIMDAVDAENGEAGKKGKKKKEKKKKDKGKGKAKDAEGAEDGEGADGDGGDDKKKGKKKKEKKVKEPKEPVEKVKSKPLLSKKAFIGLVAFCATLIAATLILSIVLPDHSDLKRGRMLYYQQDYEGVYESFYGKKLNSSDQILFDRASNLLMLQRRLDSYNARLLLDEPVEALDSLIEGVHIYQVLLPKVDSAIRGQFDSIYSEITMVLSGRYGLSVEDCLSLYNIDEATYTDVLYAIVYENVRYTPGMSFERPADVEAFTGDSVIDGVDDGSAEESADIEQSQGLADMLPQEMDLNSL